MNHAIIARCDPLRRSALKRSLERHMHRAAYVLALRERPIGISRVPSHLPGAFVLAARTGRGSCLPAPARYDKSMLELRQLH